MEYNESMLSLNRLLMGRTGTGGLAFMWVAILASPWNQISSLQPCLVNGSLQLFEIDMNLRVSVCKCGVITIKPVKLLVTF